MPKVLKVLLCGLAVSYAPLASSADEAPRMPSDFQGLLARVLDQAPERKRAILAVELAASELDTLRYKDWAELRLASSFGTTSRPEVGRTNGRFGERARHTMSLEAALPLYDFGKQAASEDIQAAAQKLTELSAREVDQQLTWQLARAYQAVVTSERLMESAAKQKALAEKKLAEQKRYYQQGLRPEIDFVAAQYDFERAEANRLKAEEDEVAAKAKLATYLAAPGETVDPRSLLLTPSSAEAPAPDAWLRQIANWSTDRENLAMKKFAVEREKLDLQRDALLRGRWPTFEFAAGVSAQNGGDEPYDPLYSVELRVNWLVPWTGEVRSRLHSVNLSQDDLAAARTLELRRQDEKLRLAKSTLEAAQTRWATLERQLSLAERQYALVTKRYDSGNASALELSSSEAQMLDVRREQIQLSHNAALAVIDIAETLNLDGQAVKF